ncbi:hypothetical protein [Pseudobacteriovorax antillogorgiicola]|uniref:Surface antigen n=1 Tax=Pseudobacteriovorax antillogorgiicola TaxID=1513793 RepID=A0A1Y6B5U6_9BACT|nr:hypothetical protein [Pseudobacteriovorax antillogorgiicola]TCS58868.1 hypothetical protein EDD56_102383 [Pseudobacteriovorax antillogorgiicola]SME93856.1 hypothetical protein SAMN06296036_10260 [Pseudobacteriovorax antillogorgiicola]
MNVFRNCLLTILTLLFCASEALALPIGFGRNQRELEYDELISPNFALYFDRRTPQEGQAVMNSLETVRPVMERWFAIRRENILPVIMSATTSNASFANFVTDALELQTMGRGGRDLAWHEFTHNMMYRHFDNIFGPVGNILHLPWLPAWWLEGLAEATSNSIGSDQIFSVERTAALSGRWPSYAKLHSLYNGDFSYTGYAISGGLVSYILRTYNGDKLPQVLGDFFDYTMPWWWPWTFVPFNDFMPFDGALVDFTGKTGEQLYEEYKRAATAHWRKANLGKSLREGIRDEQERRKKGPTKAGSQYLVSSSSALQARGDSLYNVIYFDDDDRIYEVELKSKENSVRFDRVKHRLMPDEALTTRITYGPIDVFVHRETDSERESINTISVGRGESVRPRFKRQGYIRRLFLSQNNVLWLEANREATRLCHIPQRVLFGKAKIQSDDIRCSFTVRYPTTVSFMGEKFSQATPPKQRVSEIWLSETTETIYGDRYRILKYDPETHQAKAISHQLRGKPISAAFYGKKTLLLLSDRTTQFLREITPGGRCLQEYTNPSHMIHALGTPSRLYLVTVDRTQRWIYGTDLSRFKSRSCQIVDEPRSPLLFAMHYPKASFDQALKANHPWHTFPTKFYGPMVARLNKTDALHQYPSREFQIQEASWRGRPVFAFPWIGADAKGYQFGMVSVPLMDHMQNETLTFTALYGLYSNYPNLQLDLTTTRFKTTLTASVFRRQAWNGSVSYTAENDETVSELFYFDERGVELTASRYLYDLGLSLQWGITAKDRLPYIGDSAIWDLLAHGYVNEIFLTFGQAWALGSNRLSYSVASRVAPEEINDNFKYDKLTVGTSFNVPISLFGMSTNQNYGITYGRTRGKRRPYLREVYRPLRTFVPGTGGGFNEINVGLLGPGFLTSATYGDTQARFKWAWSFPLIRHLETLIHIFYLERLDFTAFFNYGNAWDQQESPTVDDFIKAHGYNLDLQSDIKGVTVNVGVGAGQVFEQDWEMYFLFGFDALINP